jgi:hypothetical protein
MDDLEELRYPFLSAFEFFGSSFWADAAALHLDFAWIAAACMALSVLVQRGNIGRKLIALYFGLTPFNNYAFQILPGSSLGDIFGVLAVCYYAILLGGPLKMRVRTSPVGLSLCAVAVLATAHAVVIGIFHSELNANGAGLLRVAVTAKILVLGLCCCLFDRVFTEKEHIDWLIRKVVSFAVIGLATYMLQGFLLLTGTVPYGTYLDAGFIGFPSFGGICIERGHFGKMMTPLFPLFLYAALKQKRAKEFFAFAGVTLVNFSASSLVFFAAYSGIGAYYFRRKLMQVKVAVVMVCAMIVVAYFVVVTWELWVALADKINQLVIQGDSEGGRGLATFLSYLEKYPFGTSYGGSSLRTAPNLAEINMGIFALGAQLSFLSLAVAMSFLVLMYYGIRCTRHIADEDVRRILKTGILVMPIIFVADILWFVSIIWLPLLIACRLGRIDHSRIERLPGHSPFRLQWNDAIDSAMSKRGVST